MIPTDDESNIGHRIHHASIHIKDLEQPSSKFSSAIDHTSINQVDEEEARELLANPDASTRYRLLLAATSDYAKPEGNRVIVDCLNWSAFDDTRIRNPLVPTLTGTILNPIGRGVIW